MEPKLWSTGGRQFLQNSAIRTASKRFPKQIQKPEMRPNSFQQKSTNSQKHSKCNRNSGQLVAANVSRVPPPKKSKRPPKMLQNTFDVQEFFQGTCKKLLEIFHFVPLIFLAGDTEQQCHAALDALQFHSANPEWWLIPTLPLPSLWGGFETTANRHLHATQTRFVLFMSHEFNTKVDTT